MNKYEEAFLRIDATTEVGLKDTITTELGDATINKEAFVIDMVTLHELVARATPMKPVITGAKHSLIFMGCPVCKDRTSIVNNFCPHCGQALDWSETK